jgi:hypothetical protein
MLLAVRGLGVGLMFDQTVPQRSSTTRVPTDTGLRHSLVLMVDEYARRVAVILRCHSQVYKVSRGSPSIITISLEYLKSASHVRNRFL